MTTPTVTTTISAEDLQPIIDKLEQALAGVTTDHAIIALVALSLWLQSSDLTPKQLQDGVAGVGDFVTVFLRSIERGPTPDSEIRRMNLQRVHV